MMKMELSKNNLFGKLVMAIFLISLVHLLSCSIHSNKRLVNRQNYHSWMDDSIIVRIYTLHDRRIENLCSIYLDSCYTRYGCENVPLISVSFSDPTGDSSNFDISASTGVWVYKAVHRDDFIESGFQVGKTIVLVNKNSIDSMKFFNKATYSHDLTMKAEDYNSLFQNEPCLLYKEKNGGTSPIFYRLEYFLHSNDSITFIKSSEFIDRGDTPH